MSDLEIITTSDGSHTLRNTELNETYHSRHGAVQESVHVFLKNGLEYFCHTRKTESISILEVGFGTGLNALLTLKFARERDQQIRYTTLEPFPLPEEVWSKLNYAATDPGETSFSALHLAEWQREVSLTSRFAILKLRQALQEASFTESYDLVYFDAFAPAVQPELWTIDSLRKVVAALISGGIFVTYSARGQMKRDLKVLGLNVETLPGPPGKNEMVRGIKS